MIATSFIGYVSQKSWKDTDETVECTVECIIDGVEHSVVLQSTDPHHAIEEARKLPLNAWNKTVKE